jgi:predicted nucleic-acid-binding protein
VKALDTNSLVRFLVQDDEVQSANVDQLFTAAEAPIEALYIPLVVVLELIWVLQSAYGVSRKDIIIAIDALLQMPALEFEKQGVLREFVGSAKGFRGDLADLLIAHSALASDCKAVLTFDKQAARHSYFKLL